jgi:hypothetical protein
MEDRRTIGQRLLTFFGTALALYGLFQLPGVRNAWDDLRDGLPSPFTEWLDKAVSVLIGSVAALILPDKIKPQIPVPIEDTPAPHPGKAVEAMDDPMQVELARLREEQEKMDAKIKELRNHSAALSTSNTILDTRQTILRLTLFGILLFATASCVTGFYAQVMGAELNGQSSIKHLAYVGIGYLIVGLSLGAIIYFVHVKTTFHNAMRTVLLSSLIVNASSFIMTLPFVVNPYKGRAPLSIADHELPILAVAFVGRVMFLPLIATLSALAGYGLSSLIRGKEKHATEVGGVLLAPGDL